MDASLRARLSRAESPVPDAQLDELDALYRSPTRYYHTIEHVCEVLTHYRQVDDEGLWSRPDEVYFAVLYHDAIYEYGAKDNELQSALVAREQLSKWLPDRALDLDYIAHLIELTARHGALTPADVSDEEALFLDCDLAIIASSWARFEEYQAQIELEYTQVYTRFWYRLGRRRFLKKLAHQERLFLSPRFHERCDALARANLERALN